MKQLLINTKIYLYQRLYNKFKTPGKYYDWCIKNPKHANYEYFISLNPSSLLYYLWCKDINKDDTDYNIFISLKPSPYNYYLWCRDINKDDTDYNIFISLKPSSYNYYLWCRDINKDWAYYLWCRDRCGL